MGVALISIVSAFYIFKDSIYQESNAVWHAHMKFLALLDFILNFGVASTSNSASVSIRAEYTREGIAMLMESPWALVFGHPDFLPFYSGDGFYIALLVTLGLPMAFLFTFCNLVVCWRGYQEGSALSNFAATVLVCFLILFISNRILDYWPSSFIYILCFSYLVRRRMSHR